MTKTKYGRSYIPPVYHIVGASETQTTLMNQVFDGLKKCGVEFVVVAKDAEDPETINLIFEGSFCDEERAEILHFTKKMYDDMESV